MASCVVYDRIGPIKKEYRYYKIQNIAAGHDYAGINQVVTRQIDLGIKANIFPYVIM